MSVGDTRRQRHWFKLALSAARKLKGAEPEKGAGARLRHHAVAAPSVAVFGWGIPADGIKRLRVISQ
jgi:hypothetical protein